MKGKLHADFHKNFLQFISKEFPIENIEVNTTEIDEKSKHENKISKRRTHIYGEVR